MIDLKSEFYFYFIRIFIINLFIGLGKAINLAIDRIILMKREIIINLFRFFL